MKNLLSHPSEPVRSAVANLCDALTQYERSTGTPYLVIIKLKGPNGPHQYRSLCGGPAPEIQSDLALLEAMDSLM